MFRAQSQLDLLESIEKPSEVKMAFDYENFQCSDLANLIADKLCIQTADPHGINSCDYKFIVQVHVNHKLSAMLNYIYLQIIRLLPSLYFTNSVRSPVFTI